MENLPVIDLETFYTSYLYEDIEQKTKLQITNPREMQSLLLRGIGYNNKRISFLLGISYQSVKNIFSDIYHRNSRDFANPDHTCVTLCTYFETKKEVSDYLFTSFTQIAPPFRGRVSERDWNQVVQALEYTFGPDKIPYVF